MALTWKKCNICKKDIPVGSTYWRCSVSTCNSKRTGLSFCSVACWDSHLPFANHKQAGAVEEKAPLEPEVAASNDAGPAPIRRIVASPSPAVVSTAVSKNSGPREVLVIASRLKEYITAVSEFNTSANVMDALSDHLRRVTNQAIENARADGRRTVMDRDYDFLKR